MNSRFSQPWPLNPNHDTMFRLATGLWGHTAMDFPGTTASDRFMLWIDAVGGFLVCPADEVTLGQPIQRAMVDVPILADISSRHARIRRDEEGYLIEAIRDVWLGGRKVEKTASLGDGDRIELGHSVRLVFRQPHALSATARLEFSSHHRTQPSADAVLLMADACILGPSPGSHVVCRNWKSEVILYRQDRQLFCRTGGDFEIDGRRHRQKGPVNRNSRITGDGFSFYLEEVAAP